MTEADADAWRRMRDDPTHPSRRIAAKKVEEYERYQASLREPMPPTEQASLQDPMPSAEPSDSREPETSAEPEMEPAWRRLDRLTPEDVARYRALADDPAEPRRSVYQAVLRRHDRQCAGMHARTGE